MSQNFFIFGHIGLGDHLVCNALYRHYAKLHSDKQILIVCWEHNLAAVQWMLSDVSNVTLYPIESEQQLLNCMRSFPDNYLRKDKNECLRLGFYAITTMDSFDRGDGICELQRKEFFNPLKWDSEFYRQAGLDPELKWSGFKLPEFDVLHDSFIERKWDSLIGSDKLVVFHEDIDRNFRIKRKLIDMENGDKFHHSLNNKDSLLRSCYRLKTASEIHCIESSMLSLADLMESNCKRYVFHKYARNTMPPVLKKNWEILT